MKPNLDEEVDILPKRRSCVVILSLIAPLLCSNGEPPFVIGSIPVTSAVKSTREEVRRPEESEWISPCPYPLNIIPLFCPFLPESNISPVEFPPSVSVLFLRDCIVDVALFSDRPLLLVVADRVATGVPFATPVTANRALCVEVPPRAKSTVFENGERRPLFNCQ